MTSFLLFAMLSLASAADFPEGVQAEIDAAWASGLPTESLEAKAREGAAKGVPEDRVVRVLVDLRARLQQSNELLAGYGPAVVEAGAEALRRGADPEWMQVVGATEYGAVALQVYADTVALGLPAESVQQSVSTLASKGDSSSLRELVKASALLLQSGVPVNQVMPRIATTVDMGATPLAALPSDKGGPPSHSNAGGNGGKGGKSPFGQSQGNNK